MAHRQKSRDGPTTHQKLNATLDLDTDEVLRRLESYSHQPHVNMARVADDTILLLRSLSQRLRQFQAQICPSVKKPHPHGITDREITDRRRILISPVPQKVTGRSESVPYTDANNNYSLPAGDGGGQPQISPPILDNSSPKGRSTTAGDIQPDLNLPAPDTQRRTQLANQNPALHTINVCQPKGINP